MDNYDVISKLYSDIRLDNRQDFDIHLKEYEDILKGNNVAKIHFLRCYDMCFEKPTDYYISELLRIYRQTSLYVEYIYSLLYISIGHKHAKSAHQIILDGTKDGTNDSFLCHHAHKALEEAIRSDSYELVSMVLYYGGFGHIFDNGLTPFVASIYLAREIEIQRLLIDYEDDFEPNFTKVSPLFIAITENSPLILEIINRGGNINYFDGNHNVISYSLLARVSADMFKIIWEKFDYAVWEETFSKSALLFLLNLNVHVDADIIALYSSYIDTFMENEEKLRLVIQHHNHSAFRTSDSLIYILYRQGKLMNISENELQSYVLHMLSHGATLSRRDVDEMYYLSTDTSSYFFNILPFMDIRIDGSVGRLFSPLYFNYTLNPDLSLYFESMCWDIDVAFTKQRLIQICNTKHNFALTNTLQNMIIYHCSSHLKSTCIEKLLNECHRFPSLTELARKGARQTIITYFNIKNSSQFLTIVNSLNISQHLKDILLFKQWIYV